MAENTIARSVEICELAELGRLVEELPEGTVLSVQVEEVMTLAEKEGKLG